MKEDVKNFARIGRSFIANLSYLYKIDLLKQVLLLYDASTNKVFELSVSKGALKDLKELYVKTNNEHGKQE
jgi:DNA-binding LytR/AlgR family response regulator